MEGTVQQLKTKRSQLKRELTQTASRISTSIRRAEPWSTLQSLLSQSDTLFQQLEATHLELEDIFEQATDSSLDRQS